MAKKTKKDLRHTSVLFTSTTKLPNSAFCISKTTKPISTKFIYFLPYIYATSHIKNLIEIVSAVLEIKTHSSVSVAKKTKEDARHTSVLFTGTVKLLNSAFRISKTTIPISTNFTYFLSYIYTSSHIKIEGNSFSSSRDSCS